MLKIVDPREQRRRFRGCATRWKQDVDLRGVRRMGESEVATASKGPANAVADTRVQMAAGIAAVEWHHRHKAPETLDGDAGIVDRSDRDQFWPVIRIERAHPQARGSGGETPPQRPLVPT